MIHKRSFWDAKWNFWFHTLSIRKSILALIVSSYFHQTNYHVLSQWIVTYWNGDGIVLASLMVWCEDRLTLFETGPFAELLRCWTDMHMGWRYTLRSKSVFFFLFFFAYQKVLDPDANAQRYVHNVGDTNFYLEYDIKVQAYNDAGRGPESSIVTVLSAENSKLTFFSQCLIYMPSIPVWK